MKTFIKFICALVITSSLTIAHVSAKKDLTKKTIPLEKFSKLEIGGIFKIVLVKSDKYMIDIEAHEKVHNWLDIHVKNEKLKIFFKDDDDFHLEEQKKIYLTVYFKDLKKIEGHGIVKILTDEPLTLSTLDIEINGVASGQMELEVEDLSLEISGAGKMELLGTAENADLEISGAGVLKAFDFAIENCEIDISGAGSAKVFVNENLDVDLSGIAKVHYKGNPEIESDISFLCNLKKVD